MAELKALSPLAGMDPVTHGTVTLAEVDLGTLTSVAPFAGKVGSAAKVLETDHGLSFPDPGGMVQGNGTMVLWFGRDTFLLAGPVPTPGLSAHAALTDQSDAWTAATLSGAGVEDVLARLVPMDVRLSKFAEGQTARTTLAHMHGSVTRTGKDTFLLLVYRSMARTLRHDIERAMKACAARLATP